MNRAGTIRKALESDGRWLLGWIAVLLGLLVAPYVYAYVHAPAGMRFSGMLSNPLDGYTYLAKMAQGAAGSWTFQLPFTSEAHEGAFLYPYYLLLGHVARWLRLSLPLTYHLARVINSAGLMLVGYLFAAILVPDQRRRRLAWLLMFLSSGLGWLASLFGHLTPDLLVPEAIPFYSMYTNPHFPLAMAALLGLFVLVAGSFDAGSAQTGSPWPIIGSALASVVITLTQPFLFLHVGLVLIPFLAWRWRCHQIFPGTAFMRGLVAALVAVPLVVPQLIALWTNPAMRAHSAQDITLSPPLWDYGLAFAMLLLLAIWGGVRAARRRHDSDVFLLIWAVVNALLPYVPHPVQRRLVMGMQFPLAMLAAEGLLDGLLRKAPERLARRMTALILAISTLTNVFLLALGIGAASRLDPWLHLLPGEPEAMQWLAERVPAGAVVALPRTSVLIPAWTNQRVYYGHPMETLDAARKKAEIEALFAGEWAADELDAFFRRLDLAWLWIGPYERERASPAFLAQLSHLEIAYAEAGVTIYSLKGERR